MAKIGIIVAMQCELDLFLEEFHAQTIDKNIYKGTAKNNEVFLSLCGVGKVNAACATQKLIDLVHPDAILNTGVAGAIASDFHMGDLVIASGLYYHDFHPLFFMEKYEPHSQCFRPDKRLNALAHAAVDAMNKAGDTCACRDGIVVSGDRFVDDSAYKDDIIKRFGADCTEMEGAAVAHASLLSGVPFAVVRAVCDFADENADDTFEAMAARRAAAIGKYMAENYTA